LKERCLDGPMESLVSQMTSLLSSFMIGNSNFTDVKYMTEFVVNVCLLNL